MLPTITSKLPDVGTTIFTIMSQMAHDYHAINLAQGFPNFPPSEQLLDYAAKAMRDGMNQYAPMAGLRSLREAIAAMTSERYGEGKELWHPDTEITITPGATAALFAAICAVVQPGDEVIVFEPCYDSYLPAVRLCGGVPVPVALRLPDYSVDWELVEQAITPRTRMMIFNTPHNPSGMVWSADDMLRLQAIVRDTPIILLSDEVYEHITFDGIRHESVSRYEELRQRSFIVSSFGKTFHVTGWKTGYCLAPAQLMQEFRKVHQFNTFCTHTPSQYAFAKMLADSTHYTTLGAFYQQKRDYFRALLQHSRFELLPCQGSYFQLARYDALSADKDTDFCVRLTKEHRVATIPVSVFYSQPPLHRLPARHPSRSNHGQESSLAPDSAFTYHHVLRFCFAKTNETLEAAAEILCKL